MELEAIIVDPFSKTRIRNGSNLFVTDVETGDVSIHDDSEDLQEFNERHTSLVENFNSMMLSYLAFCIYMLLAAS